MIHYVDITFKPDPDFPISVLMNAAFSKLHKALVALELSRVGVSFPQHSQERRWLGEVIRMHGKQEQLKVVQEHEVFKSIRELIAFSQVLSVPDNVQHRIVRRIQVKSSAERLRRRYIKRHDVDAAKAREIIPDSAERFSELPYLTLQSSSSRQRFKLFLEHGELLESPVDGEFSAYGLSVAATIPWF